MPPVKELGTTEAALGGVPPAEELGTTEAALGVVPSVVELGSQKLRRELGIRSQQRRVRNK